MFVGIERSFHCSCSENAIAMGLRGASSLAVERAAAFEIVLPAVKLRAPELGDAIVCTHLRDDSSVTQFIAPVVVGRHMSEKLEDNDSLNITATDLAPVRELPVMWSSQGHYEYDSPLDPVNLVAQPFVQHRLAQVSGNRVAIVVTDAHLKLMREADTNLIDDGVRDTGVEIDPKRPYSDMTYFEIDMARILGIPAEGPPRADYPELRDFTEPQRQKFRALHEQLDPSCRCS